MSIMNLHVVEMMRKMKFLPGIDLGKYGAGIAQMMEPYQQPSRFAGLGYQGKNVEMKRTVCTGSSLNGYFVKEGEDFPYCGFQEPWFNSQGKRQPGLEIFFKEDLYISEGFTHTFSSQIKITKTPVESLEEEEMFGTIFDVFAIEEDYLGDQFI